METLCEKFDSLSTQETKAEFESYFELLSEWINKFNLTAITDRENVYVKHFADSIAAIDLVYGKVLDIGAGAGFPSLPLKIMKPSLKVVMADSLNKRITFLNEVIKKLSLKDIEAVHTRAEDIKEKEGFDCVVARAVAPLSTLAEYMLPFVKIGGIAVAYKSGNIQSEIKEADFAVRKLGAKIKIQKMYLDNETERLLVVMEKKKPSPPKYPRSGNKPRLDPMILK